MLPPHGIWVTEERATFVWLTINMLPWRWCVTIRSGSAMRDAMQDATAICEDDLIK